MSASPPPTLHLTPSPSPSPSPSSSPSDPLPPADPESASSSSPLKTARSLVLLQLLSRLLTFTLNQTLLRLASPSVFGTAAIQFDLVSSTILFLSREGIRNALLRQTPSSPPPDSPPSPSTPTGIVPSPIQTSKTEDDSDSRSARLEAESRERQIQALSIVPLRLGLLLSTFLTTLYIHSSNTITTAQPTFYPSLALYVLAALMELSIEPIYIRIHRSSPPKLSVRVQAEGGMAVVRAVVTVSALLALGEKRALLGFAVGQVAGSLWLFTRYVREIGWNVKSLVWVKKEEGGEKQYDPTTLSLAMANTGQSVIKHLLTEADRLAVARISPLEDQGGYAVAMNYGSLIARIIFQPLEESLLLHFSSSLSPSSLPLVTLIIRLSTTFALLIRTFVPPLYPAISPLLLPRQYRHTSAPAVLQLYLTTYIPVLSLNGLLESFHTASASPAQVKKQARWMVFSSMVFAGALVLLGNPHLLSSHFAGLTTLTYLNGIKSIGHWPSREEALVLSSSCAMVARIIYALRHARSYFSTPSTTDGRRTKTIPWKGMINAPVYLWTWPIWLGLTKLQQTGRWESWKGWVELVGAGGVLGVLTLGVVWWTERGAIADLRGGTRKRKTD